MIRTILVTASLAFASTAGAVEITNLYDAFGDTSAGTEHSFGFSALIKHGDTTILFDAGTSADVLERNAKALGVNLADVDFAVASHAHADHTGGFDALLKKNPKVKIYFPNDFFGAGGPLTFDVAGKEPGAAEKLPEKHRYFGGRTTKAELVSDGRYYKAVEYVKESREIAPGIHLIATRSDNMGYFTSYPGVDLHGKPTTSKDKKHLGLPELSLSITTPKGQVLLVGCSHSTVELIVKEAKRLVKKPVHLLAGGYHLLPYDRKTVRGIATRLKKKLGVRHVAPAHCTGHLAFVVLRKTFGDRYRFFGLGETLRL